jgi:hypothetical protein
MTSTAGWISSGLVSAFPTFLEEFHHSTQDTINGLVNWVVLMFGIGVNLLAFPALIEIGLFLGTDRLVFRSASNDSHRSFHYVCNTYLGSREPVLR